MKQILKTIMLTTCLTVSTASFAQQPAPQTAAPQSSQESLMKMGDEWKKFKESLEQIIPDLQRREALIAGQIKNYADAEVQVNGLIDTIKKFSQRVAPEADIVKHLNQIQKDTLHNYNEAMASTNPALKKFAEVHEKNSNEAKNLKESFLTQHRDLMDKIRELENNKEVLRHAWAAYGTQKALEEVRSYYKLTQETFDKLKNLNDQNNIYMNNMLTQ